MKSKKTFLQRFGCAGMALMLLVGGGLGVYAGTQWRDQIWSGAEGVSRWSRGVMGGDSPKHGHQLWTCSMHPQVIRDGPGLCPICHMELTPIEPEAQSMMPPGEEATTQAHGEHAEHRAPAAVVIDPVTVQNMGVRLAKATAGSLHSSVRLAAYVDEAQPMEYAVTLRVSGWITKLYANIQGQHIKAGDPLLDLYSPELRVAIQELIAARKSRRPQGAGTDGAGAQAEDGLYGAIARKLELMGLSAAQVAEMARLDEAPQSVRIYSPISGHLIDKPVIEGAAVQKGDRVLRIVDHSQLWVDGQAFEKDLGLIAVGQEALATFASLPGVSFKGKIMFIHPHIDMATRSSMVRMVVSNPEMKLRPGMFGSMRVEVNSPKEVVQIPSDAILDTGERQVVFVSLGGGRFEPRELTLGGTGDDGMVEIVKGVAAREEVVVSGQFLIDSESKLREAVRKFTAQRDAATTMPASSPSPMDTEVKP
jgi:membrane fusion protein, copper/silver efflux system